ncbi:hypothetical protein [Burkholderia sp. Tr-20390]|uniref:hypothetical protein n=1 Tax=Burkholderia sp. Tr-20390 TaxID=2703904 RepID=UPI00197DC9DA|nr:hypothetical protein [Burkholderia sp. Tr-20390]MBN3729434.1 hypothetical protein [Burkholderia sp. Tr-20390]
MFRAVTGWILTIISAFFVLFLCLHLLAIARLWSTDAMPEQWPANLAIAIAIGATGVAGMKWGITLARRPAAIRSMPRDSR